MGAKLGLVPAFEFAPQKHAGLVPDYIECASFLIYKKTNTRQTTRNIHNISCSKMRVHWSE